MVLGVDDAPLFHIDCTMPQPDRDSLWSAFRLLCQKYEIKLKNLDTMGKNRLIFEAFHMCWYGRYGMDVSPIYGTPPLQGLT